MFCMLLLPPFLGGQTKLLRFPDIAGNQLVFCYGGDLWTAPAGGGSAVRLTAHPGLELFPRFSPDGKWIAFTGQYDGDEQVYVIPAGGGVPRQLTFYPARGPLAPRHGYDNQVYGWTPDGASVLFRSMRDAGGGSRTRLYTVAVAGGPERALPMPTAGAGDFSPDAQRMVYSPLFRDFRHWKRYEGGWAQDLFLFDMKTSALTPVSPSLRTERDPMWMGDAICFVSDRDGVLNLYMYGLKDGKVVQLTRNTVWDVRWASSDNARNIVYELNGELHIYDIKAKSDRAVSVLVPSDGVAMRPSHLAVERNIESFSLSPKGERALFTARGDIFTVPIEKGPTRNLTNSSGAHDRSAGWSPDGTRIAFVSDRSGEDEIWLIDQAGGGEPVRLTSDGSCMRFAPEWSPDGKLLAFSDSEGRLFVLTVADRKTVLVADDERGRIRDYTWASKGGWLAFTLSNPNNTRSLYLWSAGDGRKHRVTDEFFGVGSPAWDPEGKYLFFLSDRDYAPQISGLEWNFAGNRTTGIFAMALRKDIPHLFPPQSDEVSLPAEGKEKSGEKTVGEAGARAEEKKPEKKEEGDLSIDLDGLASRVVRVPVAADNLDGLSVIKGHLLYAKSGAPFYGRESYARTSLWIFSLKDREESLLAEDISGAALSADGSKILVRQGRSFNLYEARPKVKEKKTVSTAGLAVDRVPAQEWEEVFNEVWRRYRDFFYVRNMHGYDWKAIGDRYRAWLPHVAHRSDLNYVLTEMVAELNVGHAYIEGGDFLLPERPRVALPGCRFEPDAASGRFRIARIFRGQNEEERYRSPLTEVGIGVKEGEYVLAIDGVDLKTTDNPYRLLQHKTHPVTLTVNGSPTSEGARRVTYRPVESEESLIYLDWVLHNYEQVTRMSDGQIGYLHIPDMGAPGIAEFIKWFYPQVRKQGLVVDVRSNGGGNVSQWIIERLDNRLLGTRFGRSNWPGTYPEVVFQGHKACLLNETSASDGDIFPFMFRQAGLGPLIGKRSWGGVVGISNTGPLLDGGTVFVPLSGTNAPDGSWVIEGHGVDPDIFVENDPRSVIEGRDLQLERAVAEIKKAIAGKPVKLPARPAEPVKTPKPLP